MAAVVGHFSRFDHFTRKRAANAARQFGGLKIKIKAYRTVGPLRSVNTTGPPALMTVGLCAVMMSVPRLSSRAEIPMMAIISAAASPTTTILRWVVRSAVYIDQFMTSSGVLLIPFVTPFRQKVHPSVPFNVATMPKFPRVHHGSLTRCDFGRFLVPDQPL